MIKNIIKYGIIAGIIVSILMLLSARSGGMTSAYGELIGYSGMVAAFSMIFVGIKKFRDSHPTGKVPFLHSLLMGLGISLIATIFYAVTWGFIDGFTGGQFIDQYISAELTRLEESGATAEQVANKAKEMNSYRVYYQNPILKMLITCLEIFPVGILVSLTSAFIFWIKDRKTV
ncbi:MAG: DUF4199 domain-containing protein [Bacteroidota bacterium]